jgi:hypothetical protein
MQCKIPLDHFKQQSADRGIAAVTRSEKRRWIMAKHANVQPIAGTPDLPSVVPLMAGH